MNNEKFEDYAIKTVKALRDSGDLIASFLLCSAFVEHYCKTRLFTFLTANRPIEIRKVKDKLTKKTKNASVWSDMKRIIWKTNLSQRRIIDLGFLVFAWDFELRRQLIIFNKKRNRLVHEHENLLEILEDEKEVRDIIERVLSLLHNIKSGFAKSKDF